MKEIIKLLKSMQSWIAVIALIVAVIGIYPIIEKWMVNDPVIYFGKGNKLEEGKSIIVNYIIPKDKQNSKVRFSFPVVFANENNIMLEKFFISLKAPAVRTSNGGWMPRLLPYNEFYASAGKKNNLLEEGGQRVNNRGIQEDGNSETGIIFSAGGIYRDVFIVNMYNNANADVWDFFDFMLTVGAQNCKTKEYDFSVRCYVVDDVEKKKAEIMKMKKSSNEQRFLIIPNFLGVVATQDSIVTSIFDVDSEDVTNLIIRY